MRKPRKRRSVLPGFGLSMGFTLIYLSLVVLIPLSTLFLKTATLTWATFWATVTDAEVVAERLATLREQLAAGTSDAAEQVADVDSSDGAAVRQAGLVHAALVAALNAVERAREAQRGAAAVAIEVVAKPAPATPMTKPTAVTIAPLAERNPQALHHGHPEELRADVEPKTVTVSVAGEPPPTKAKRARKTPRTQEKDLYVAQG